MEIVGGIFVFVFTNCFCFYELLLFLRIVIVIVLLGEPSGSTVLEKGVMLGVVS